MRRLILRWLITILTAASTVVAGVVLYHTFNPSLTAHMIHIAGGMPASAVCVMGRTDSNTILVQEAPARFAYYTVDIRTGRKVVLTDLNARIRRAMSEELAGGGFESAGLSPDGKWILFEGWRFNRDAVFVAVPVTGGKAVLWPRAMSRTSWQPDYAWLPDSRGFVQAFPGGNSCRLRLYRLDHPRTFAAIQMAKGFQPEVIGDVTPEKIIAFGSTGKILTVFYFDRADLRKPPVTTALRLPVPDMLTTVFIDGRRGLIFYEIERERVLPYALRELQRRYPSLPIRDPENVREVWIADLRGRASSMLGRYPVTGSMPESVGWLPDGRPAFIYRGALYAVPLPRIGARGG